MLIFKNTASKSGQIFQIGRRKQEGTLERQWLRSHAGALERESISTRMIGIVFVYQLYYTQFIP